MPQAKLFTPFSQKSVTLPNRIVVSPMSQYSSTDGYADDWHTVTYGKMAQGGAGTVVVEVAAVTAEGRGTYGDLGIWSDEHIPGLKNIAQCIANLGAVPALQLGHAGRKACLQRPWEGYGNLTSQEASKGETPWQTIAPSAIAPSPEAVLPVAATEKQLQALLDDWVAASNRAAQARFQILEIHCAHGYLLHQFLSPLTNLRDDQYGGDPIRRRAFPLKVIRHVREAWPAHLPLWVRVSATDGAEGGSSFEDMLAFCAALKDIGVDLVDCSSGGIAGSSTAAKHPPRALGFQVTYADAVRQQAGIPTMAVGLIVSPTQAENVLQEGCADLVAMGRELLKNPNWPLLARKQLQNEGYECWPQQHGWWLEKRAAILENLGYPNELLSGLGN